jgi:selenocysteine lyase/cysteine desulfurase
MTDWRRVREEFPSLRNWTYLNSATYGQVPSRAVEAMNRYFVRLEEFASSDFLSWYDDADLLRGSIARLVNASADDIAFCASASMALSWLLQGLEWQPGDRIVTLENEFPNSLYAPWFARGAEFVQVAWERFYESITPATRLVVVSLLNYATGFRPPLEEIGPYLRERGVLLFVDGTQGVGALRFDCARVRPSMLAAHGYKWLLCPTGAGFCYVAPEVRARVVPQVIGWRSHHAWREVDNLHHGKPEFSERAEKYEGGGLPITLLYAMQSSIDLLLEIGPEKIEGRVLGLAEAVRSVLREHGAEVADGDTPVLAGRFPRHDVPALARRLRERRVVVSARHGHLRVSPHLYNDESDIDRFRTELRAAL